MKPEAELLQAVKEGELDKVRAILTVDPELLYAGGEGHMTLVITAIHYGKKEMAHFLARERLRDLKAHRVKVKDMYDVLHDMGEAGLTDAESEVVGFLRHKDPRLREIALSVLTLHWDMARYRDELERLLTEDPSEHVRRMAVVGLGFVLRESRDNRATRVLLKKLRDLTEDVSVRKAAYEALLDVWFPEAQRSKEKVASIREGFEEVEGLLKATDLPDPYRALEISELSKQSEAQWDRSVDWNLVASIERGEIR